jgi:hypothetical protein
MAGFEGSSDSPRPCANHPIYTPDSIRFIVCILLSISAASPTAFADPTATKLELLDGQSRAGIGAVDIDRDTAVVGASRAGVVPNPSGGAYVYRKTDAGWIQEAELLPGDPGSFQRFGAGVAIDGDVIVVGAHADHELTAGAGAVYVFRRSGNEWNQEAKLLASDGAPNDHFGFVDIWGDTILVYNKFHDHDSKDDGALFVFRHNGSSWVEEAEIRSPNPVEDGRFGSNAAIWKDRIIVSELGQYSRKKVYVFRRDGGQWEMEDRLLPTSTTSWYWSFLSLSIWEDVAIIGASREDNENGHFAGSALVFRCDGTSWTEEAKLLASNGHEKAEFGRGVSIWGDRAIVGAIQHSEAAPGAGAAFLFQFDGNEWIEKLKLFATDPAAGYWFGAGISLQENTAIVGRSRDTGINFPLGEAYIYEGLISRKVAIDVRPGTYPNHLKPMNPGLIPVAILGDHEFDVSEIDVANLAFGPEKAPPFHRSGGHLEDVNHDGFLDWLSHYRIDETGIGVGDTEACVRGNTKTGEPIEGCDSIAVENP